MTGRGEMGRQIGTLGLLVAVVMMLVACGGSGIGARGEGSDSPKTEASTTGTGPAERTLPEEDYISAGRYEASMLDPELSVRVDERWLAIQIPNTVVLIREEDELQVAFLRAKTVFDPSRLAEGVQKPAPESVDGWMTWLQDHPNLDTDKPVPATVGGVTGKRIDLFVSNIPEDYPEECRKPCVPGYSTGDEGGVFDYVASRYHRGNSVR